MGPYVLLFFIVGCRCFQLKAIDDLEDIFKEHSKAARVTISSIDNLLNSSTSDSESFLSNAYSENQVIQRITQMKLSNDKCLERFIDEENLKLSYQIQIYQLQIPLRSRVLEIRERLDNINASLDIYQGLGETKFHSCKAENGNCLKKTNEWLESVISPLSCAIYPNCSNHAVRKRSTCSPGQFKCINGGCISSSYFCDTYCHCEDCSDRPPGCVKDCYEFRCKDTFLCIPLYMKCNGLDDCGDGSDEEECPFYTHANCSIYTGNFLCGTMKCISLERVCDSYNDCGDWSDEGSHCNISECTPGCERKGGLCFRGSKGAKCLYECPPGTFETSHGCSRTPEAPLPTLLQVLADTPRLMTRYATRVKYLKTKTIIAISNAVREVVKCKEEEFTLLSKVIDFSTIIREEIVTDKPITWVSFTDDMA